MRVCWLWVVMAAAVALGSAWLAFRSYIGFLVFTSVGLSLLAFATPLMVPMVVTMLRFGRIVETVSYESLLDHIEADDATFVGEGWSFWLNYARPPRRRVISMSRSHAGVVSIGSDHVVARAGTRLGDLQGALRGRTLRDRSQFDDMTLGGALKTLGHGFCTRAWMTETVLSIDVVWKGTRSVVTLARDDAGFVEAMRSPDAVLLQATLRLVEDAPMHLVHAEAASLAEHAHFDAYLEAPYRMVFVTGQSVVAEWLTPAARGTLVSSRLHIRVQAALQMARWSQSYRLTVPLSKGHSYVSSLDAIETASIHLLGYINFELFVPCHTELREVIEYAQQYHRRFKGRTEIRERVDRSRHVLALDVALHCRAKDEAVRTLLRDLHDRFGVCRVGMHRGKYQLRNVQPLQLVEGYAL